MVSRIRTVRTLVAFGGLLMALATGACGSNASQPKVGDCIDSQRHVVSCSSSAARMRLVSNQLAPNAIACLQIGDKPQVQLKVGKGSFCAERAGGLP